MMAESALKIPKFKIMGDALKVYNKVNGVAQEGATTQAAMMDFLQNNNDILRCFVEMLWQEQKPVVVGQLVWSPSLPNGVIAKVTQAGTLGADEPIWPSIVGSTVESGSAVLKIVLWAPETLPADGGTAALANNAEKLGGQLPAYYATATQLAAKAALLSPAFAGIPTAPTADAGTNTDQIATTKFVMTALSALSSQGKIVSYSLAQNGYCKWDIGLILQWGENVGGGGQTVSLPISFEVAFTAVVSADSSWCNASCHITTTTITTMNYQSNRPDIAQAGPVQWLALGCQLQWGKILGDTVNLKIINFPVSFNECFGGLALFNGDPVAAAEYATITDITNTNFKIYMYANNAGTGYANANIFYLFLGAQPQWGSSASLSGYVAVCIFPISFTTTDYTAVATGVMSAADATFGKENYVNNILWDFTSESQVAFRLSHLDRPTLKYIAIGF